MGDNFIRKPVVFNRNSEWHMEIYKRISKESDNFSGYVMSILKGHFDAKKPIEKGEPIKGARIVLNGKLIK